MASTSGRVALAVLVSAMGGGAYQMGKGLAPADVEVQAKPKAFAGAREADKKKYSGDLSKVISTEKSKDDSMGLVSGSLDGKTAEQRAAEAAAAEAAAKAAAEKEAQASATPPEQPTAGGGPAGGTPGAGSMDPAAMMAAAGKGQAAGAGTEAEKKGPFASRFGNMASSLGGGGSGASLSGGSGLAGGVGRSFRPELGGAVKGFRGGSTPGRSAAQVARVPKGKARGFAARQLEAANRLSQAARSGSAENRAANASAAFDNNPGGNTALTGGGAGSGARPAGGGTPDASGGTNPGGGSGGTNPGDSFEPEPDECANGQISSSAGGCVDPPKPGGTNVSPWKMITQIAVLLTVVASILLLLAALLAYIGRPAQLAAPVLITIAQFLGGIAAVLGAITMILGVVLMGMGQVWQGAIFTVTGLLTTISGAWVAIAPDTTTQLESGKTLVVSSLQALIGGVIGAGVGGAGLAGAFD